MIEVRIMQRTGRRSIEAWWVDPVTERKIWKSTRETDPVQAAKVAASIQDELNRTGSLRGGSVLWSEFRERYLSEKAVNLAERTREKIISTLNSFEQHIHPKNLNTITAGVISRYTGKLRRGDDKINPPKGRKSLKTQPPLAGSSIKSNLAHLKAAFNWAKRMGMISEVPYFEMPTKITTKKRRPVTLEEIERMESKSWQVVGVLESPWWNFYIRGLWLSGLRLSESLVLSWDDHRGMMVDLSGKFPMFHVSSEIEKGKKDRMLPMAPDFAEFLCEVPPAHRSGLVFKGLKVHRGFVERMTVTSISHTVSGIAEKAGVVVGDLRSGEPKYATPQTMRKSFGDRWSFLVLPRVLQEMMRHDSITTTMKHYTHQNADLSTVDIEEAWQKSLSSASRDISGDSSSSQH